MSIMYAALNPNLSDKDLIELIERQGESQRKLIATFGECLDKIETPEQKMQYFNACLPILISTMF